MILLNHTKPRMLIADEGKHIRARNDVYVPEHTDGKGNVIPEYIPYYTTVIFVGEQLQTLEQCKELYIEEENKGGTE